MFNKFNKGSKVFVNGIGQNNGKVYKNAVATVIERDPYFKDYLVRFKDNTEDWILPKDLRKPYERKKKGTKL